MDILGVSRRRGTGKDAGYATLVIQTEGKKGWFLVHPPARQFHQRRRRSGLRLLVQEPRRQRSRSDLFRGSGTLPRRQETDRQRQTSRTISGRQGVHVSLQTVIGRAVIAGAGRRCVYKAFSTRFIHRGYCWPSKSGSMAADARVISKRSRCKKGDHFSGSAGKWEEEFTKGAGPHEAARGGLLRRHEFPAGGSSRPFPQQQRVAY